MCAATIKAGVNAHEVLKALIEYKYAAPLIIYSLSVVFGLRVRATFTSTLSTQTVQVVDFSPVSV